MNLTAEVPLPATIGTQSLDLAQRVFGTPLTELTRFVQVTPAPPTMASTLATIALGDCDLHRLTFASGIQLRSSPGRGTSLAGLIAKRTAKISHFGSSWTPHEIAFSQTGSVDLFTLGPSAYLFIEAKTDWFREHFDPARLGNDGSLLIDGGPSVDALREMCDSAFRLNPPQTANVALRDRIVRNLSSATQSVELRRPSIASRQRFALASAAEDFMWANVEEPLQVHQVAAAVHCSARTLLYCFTRTYGLGPIGYFKIQRLNAVKNALIDDHAGRSILDIAADYGFWHLGHFGSAFKALFGMTPSEMRGGQCARRESNPHLRV